MSFHEDYTRTREVQGPSDRAFGLTIAAVFALIALWPLLFGEAPRIWAVIVVLMLAIPALVWPRVLRPLNRLWLRLGLLLHRVATPLLLGLTFYGVVLPTGLLMRAFGKRPLRLELDRDAATYWLDRDPAAERPDSLKDQF